MKEIDVLDQLFEAVKDDASISVDLYPARPGFPVSEMYVTIKGECWRIRAERHYHDG